MSSTGSSLQTWKYPVEKVKFCKSEHNLTKGCSTIALGTLESYSTDDPGFMRYDNEEGTHKVHNRGTEVSVSPEDTRSITGGGIDGFGLNLENGSSFQHTHRFPNCYIFCFGYGISPTIENARQFDPSYDSWYGISDIPKFCHHLTKLLWDQLTLEDLLIPPNPPLSYLKGLRVEVAAGPAKYEERGVSLTKDTVEEAKRAVESPIKWILRKDPKYRTLPEYRIVLLIYDTHGDLVPVVNKLKILSIFPGVADANAPDVAR